MSVAQSELEIQPAGPILTAPEQAEWSGATCACFRLAFTYFVLYNFPFPLGALPHTEYLADKYAAIWHVIVPWVGKHVLRLGRDITVFSNGSGDTTYDYVVVLCYLALAMLATVAWSIADRRRPNYRSLHRWLRLYVRLTLGGTMAGYGAYKVIQSQFPAPSLSHLLEPYGEASPMGLLWTWMGASHLYNVFAGLCEMTGAVLLFVPRVTTLGALMLIGVLSNVFILNMSYDVPVKLYSFHLILMAIFLTLPDLGRLADFFVWNRKVQPATETPLFRWRALNRWALVFQVLFGATFVATSLYQSHEQAVKYGTSGPKPPLYGIWSVEEFVFDGAARPPLLTDELRWQRMIFEYSEVVSVQSMSGKRQPFSLKVDESKRVLSLGKFDDKNWRAEFAFAQTQPDTITLDGKLDGKRAQLRLERTQPRFLLTDRRFHWINEYPFDR